MPRPTYDANSATSAVEPAPVLVQFDEQTAALLLEHMLNAATYCQVLFDGDAAQDLLHLYTNPAFRRHTGLEAEGRRGTEVLPALQREDRQMLETCGRVARSHAPAQLCFFFSSVGAWCELSIFSPHADHVVVIFNVIKDQVRKAQTLRQQYQWWHSTLAAMRDAVFVCDTEANVIEMNDAFVRYHRFKDSAECLRAFKHYAQCFEVRSSAEGDLLPLADWPSPRALRGERATDVLYHLKRVDTGECWIGSYDFGPIRNREGAIVGAVVVIREVTRQVAQQRALRGAWVKLREMKRALAALDVAVCRFDSLSGHIIEADPLMRHRLGYTPEELCRLSPWELDVSVKEDSLHALLASLRTEGSLRAEGRHRTKDGREIPVDIHAYLQPTPEAVSSPALAFVRDVSTRYRRRQVLKKLRQENLQLTKTAVASVTAAAVAHEMNQPLMAMALSNATALYLLEANAPASAVREALEATDASVQRAGKVLRDLILFLNKRDVEQEILNLNELVRDVARRRQPEQPGGHRVRTRLMRKAAWVQGNRVQLEKVLANLIDNGLEAMADQAPGTVEVRLRLERDGTRVRISVVDQGAGMAKETLARVFEPFFTTKPTGLGMGLAICKSLIAAHQGRLWARSSPKRGSAFHAVLPLSEQKGPSVQPDV